ncbi:hypothetical protein [Bradyrhizobium sp. LB11.1]|uniref:hypothetical protein n=1 Tax=Bradyrhizobium sp. LB11.1 TaxID=3156326 RepID=UPI0033972D90
MTNPLIHQVALAIAALDQENALVAARLREDPQLNPDAVRLQVGSVKIARAEGLPHGLAEAIESWALNNETAARAWLNA